MNQKELIQIVNDLDEPVGGATKQKTWQQGLRHRIVRVMLEDDKGRILLQKRTSTMQLWPKCWDNSASGHVDEGESYIDAAKRELAEELGLIGLPLVEIGYYKSNLLFEWRKLNRFNKVYKVKAAADIAILPQATELSKVQWFTIDEVKRLIKEKPNDVTDGLLEIMQRFY